MPIKIIAHRGLGPTSEYTSGKNGQLPTGLLPENSIESFRAALLLGVDGVECDVCPSKDNHPMVIHNNRLNKNVYQAERDETNLGFIAKLKAEEIQAKNEKGGLNYPLGPNGEKIPLLHELLDLIIEISFVQVIGLHQD